MTATTKFYTGFFLVLAIVVAVAFYAGYRTGFGAAGVGRHQAAHAKP